MNMRAALYAWRDSEARSRGLESFRILPNTTLDAILRAAPKNIEELLMVKGIKEAKSALYGRLILSILSGNELSEQSPSKEVHVVDKVSGSVDSGVNQRQKPSYSVGQYLDILNSELFRISARIKGEIVSFQERGRAIYFTIKDTDSESVLNVFMWSSDYALSGISIEVGMEVIVSGRSEIYKPTGRLSLHAESIEIAGEGALKKAYEELRKKLSTEGLFDPERKRTLQSYPIKIGVITSKQGAVIHDFLNNLGSFGYKVTFTDSRVEGVLAVRDVLNALERLKPFKLDVVVLIRGGGSLESLQAFNNEHVVRAISKYPIPIICSIGHDKDIPLAQLAADYSPSTPTACTSLINESWINARTEIESAQSFIFYEYEKQLNEYARTLERETDTLERALAQLRKKVTTTFDVVNQLVESLIRTVETQQSAIAVLKDSILKDFANAMDSVGSWLVYVEELLLVHDPLRQLRLGYSIVRKSGAIIRSVKKLREGDTIETTFADGHVLASVEKIQIL